METTKRKIAGNLWKIKHWQFVHGSYEDIPNQRATWFIDPPYQFGGHKYKQSNKNIDFTALAAWCRSRQGHIIVCENTQATWMDFKPMVKQQTSKGLHSEAIFSNIPTAFDHVQQKIIF